MRLYRFGAAEHFDAAVNAAGIALFHLFILPDRREVVYEALNAETFQRRWRVCHLREKPYVVAVRVREYPRRDLYVLGVRSLLFELIHKKLKILLPAVSAVNDNEPSVTQADDVKHSYLKIRDRFARIVKIFKPYLCDRNGVAARRIGSLCHRQLGF